MSAIFPLSLARGSDIDFTYPTSLIAAFMLVVIVRTHRLLLEGSAAREDR